MADTKAPAKGGNLFTRKIGPLPMWAWTSIVGVPIIIWAIYEHMKNSSSSSTSSTGTGQQPEVVVQDYGQVPAGGATSTTTTQSTPPEQQPPTPVTGTGDGETSGSGSSGGTKKPAPKKKATGKTIGNNGAPIGHGGTIGGGSPPAKTPVTHHTRVTSRPHPTAPTTGPATHPGQPTGKSAAPKKSTAKRPPVGQAGVHSPLPRAHG